MTLRIAKPFAISATAIALCLGGAATAQDMGDYITMFEPLPAMPPIPSGATMSAERIELGRMLFFEPRISASGVISCATCHNPALGWTDRIPRATGHDGQVGDRNTPTVLNSGFLEAQFWDGREPDLEGQALGPIAASIEMNMAIEDAISRLKEFEVYRNAFAAAEFQENRPDVADNGAKPAKAHADGDRRTVKHALRTQRITDIRRSQALSHGVTAAAHAVRSGDSHGGGASISLSESDRT